jgi:RNA polymerase sigma-70 factor (ECF subfamily)
VNVNLKSPASGSERRYVLRPGTNTNGGNSASQRFATTQWSIVVAAGRRSSPQSKEALATLCGAYWYPLYALVRAQGYSPHDAQDLTQEFFTRLLARNDFAAADRAKGRFRSYLSAALKHFLANARDQARTKKRGAGRISISLDFANAETRLSREPTHALTAEKAYARRWALTLLDQVLATLRREFSAAGKKGTFDRLKSFLSDPKSASSYAEVAADLSMTEGALKVAVHRLRRRYRELLRAAIAQTVADPAEVEDEICELFAALASE